MIYKLNRDIGEYKKGMTVSIDGAADTDISLHLQLFVTWQGMGWLDPVEEGRWKPKYGELAYYLSTSGLVYESTSWSSNQDKRQIGFGNCFKTREQAEEAAKQMKELLLSLHK